MDEMGNIEHQAAFVSLCTVLTLNILKLVNPLVSFGSANVLI